MRLIWTVNGLPELQPLDPEARRQLLKRCKRGGQVQIILSTLFCMWALGQWIALGLWAYFIYGGYPHWLVVIISQLAGAIAMTPVGLVIYLALLSGLRQELRLRLAPSRHEQQLTLCPACGYDLRATTSDKCPECGATRP